MTNPNLKLLDFKKYLSNCFPETILTNLSALSKSCDLYVFSGVIRDYIIDNKAKPKDLDIVVNNLKTRDVPVEFLQRFNYKKNQYGGLKILVDGINIDIWSLPDTWGIREQRLEPTPESLVRTAFFNFSAVAYDFNKEVFVHTPEFLRFINDGVLDVVYESNPLPSLCIVSSLHYSKTKHLEIADKLSVWIKEHYCEADDFQKVQENHFGRVIYSNKEISNFINNL